MPTVQEQLANIRSQAERIQGNIRTIGEAEGRGYRGGRRTSVQGAERFLGRPVSTPTAITPLDLTGSATPVVTPPAPPTSQAGAFVQSTQDSVDQRAKDYAASVIDQNKTTELKATDKTFREKIAELLGGPGQTERTDKAYSKDVDPAKKELDDIQNQIREKSLAARRQVEEIEKNKSGMLESGVNYEVNRVNKENARELADLSIIEQAKLANYSTAKEIADRKVAIETEQQKNELDAYKFFYQENKADLTKAEDREFNAMISERERLLKADETRIKNISDLAIEAIKNGAPISVAEQMQKAGSIEEALRIGGTHLSKETGSSGLVEAVILNPVLFNQLTPSDKAAIIPALYARGFTQFGKPLSDTAIKEISQTQDAISGLNDLKAKIAGNEQYIGPISGLQRFNPYSKARQIQADVDRIRQVVGKALEGGVLRKEDEEKYKKILATLADTPSTATYKIDALIGDLTRNVETYSNNQALSGRNVPGAGTSSSPEDLRKKYNY